MRSERGRSGQLFMDVVEYRERDRQGQRPGNERDEISSAPIGIRGSLHGYCHTNTDGSDIVAKRIIEVIFP